MGACAHRNLKHLRDLNLKEGCFTDSGLRGLSSLTALFSLSLRCCHRLTESGLIALMTALSRHSLASVDVAGCKILSPAGSKAIQRQVSLVNSAVIDALMLC